MNDTPFNTRSSEWIGDMTVWLRNNAEDNSDQLNRMRRNLRRARETELTPRQQLLVHLYFDEQLKINEIARRLDVHPSTVCRTLQRAKQRLRRSLRYTI